jgi:ligand-binding SRPBCC domain-containing protein
MIVNVCPAATTSAPPDRIWRMLTASEGYGDWMDAEFVSASPPGAVEAGQQIRLAAPSLGRRWPVTLEVKGVDPDRRWLDLRIDLPFGIVNDEHVTLTETRSGGTLVRFN